MTRGFLKRRRCPASESSESSGSEGASPELSSESESVSKWWESRFEPVGILVELELVPAGILVELDLVPDSALTARRPLKSWCMRFAWIWYGRAGRRAGFLGVRGIVGPGFALTWPFLSK